MRGTWISRLRRGAAKLVRDQGGNAMMLTAAAIVPVIGIVGSGIDIGRAYMAQLRLQQACDAGVLAGRRYMGASSYSDAAKAEAAKMFDFNYPASIYGSEGVTFESQPQGTSDVVGTATARLPTSMMHIFGFEKFDLAVNCAAKLEISNTDVMLVLDVTGSMAGSTSDGTSRISGLKEASMVFFDTLTQAEKGDGRLRIGIVPYSSSVNIGRILIDKNPDWVADFTLLPSRSPVIRHNWGTGDPPSSVTSGTTTNGSWSNFIPISNFASSSSCSALTPPGDSMPALTSALDTNRTTYTVDKNGARIYAPNAGTRHVRYNYRYNYSSSDQTCWLQRRTVTFDHAASTNPSSTQFYNQYRYEDRVFDMTGVKAGGSISADTGDSGAVRTYSWGGCVIERRTSDFGPTSTAPDDALDMRIDVLPEAGRPDTQWQILIPQIAFPRARRVSSRPTFPNPSSPPDSQGIIQSNGQQILVHSNYVTGESSTNGYWQNYSRYSPNGWAVCPAEALKLTTMDSSDRSFFQGKIDTLQPLGGTYHDSGMTWGVRLISPTGLFADENATAPNNRPISRHIIFMTDGEMAPNMGNLSFQGYEYLMNRVGGSINLTDAQLEDRHNNRFLQICNAARSRNITIWVIGFGVDLNTQLTTCATPGKAYQTRSANELKAIFASIAGQISRLRLSQ